ncbi:SDR family oxidoreductase [Pseudoclavibacter chungangensis]|uniref:SDR family oxidoreductase n=1 Tax=Pseudoclavibacter chungangensis TaxID=587635 RepID=A0A7J5BPR8_9MICO|nr:SDR family oxidoreductase [Pseudoclavibacter chungangensis]
MVTGASSGIGEATARELRRRGWEVVATARRADRLDALAAETGVEPVVADLTSPDDVARLTARVAEIGPVQALVNVAGGALGVESVEQGSEDDWRRMFETNVLATKDVIATLLPLLREGASADANGFVHADIVTVTSTAASVRYEGGAGYSAAKAAEAALVDVLRLELAGEPIRVTDIAPGLVHTPEFSKVRLRGDADAAERIYEDVDHPLVAGDIALVIAGTLELPGHVNLDKIVVRPIAQAAHYKLVRGPLEVRGPGERS